MELVIHKAMGYLPTKVTGSNPVLSTKQIVLINKKQKKMGYLITWLIIGLAVGVIAVWYDVKDIDSQDLTRKDAFFVIILSTGLGFFSMIAGIIYIGTLLSESENWQKFWNTPLVNDNYYKSKQKNKNETKNKNSKIS